MVVDNRSSIPVSPYQGVQCADFQCMGQPVLDAVTDPAAVAIASHDFAQTENDANARRTRYYDFLGLSIMGIVIILGLLVVLKVTGKI
jgi:hypothetical protein